MPSLKPRFFPAPGAFRAWLAAHHATAKELLVGFHKVGSVMPSITWPQSVDEALCFGWIDGVRKRIDDHSYTIRFTPRKSTSKWSTVNIKKMNALIDQGKVLPAGLKAFELRKTSQSGTYSYEQRHTAKLDRAAERTFRANAKAWTYFQSRAPWYRRTTTWWVISAKKAETRERRLRQLIEASARGRLVGILDQP